MSGRTPCWDPALRLTTAGAKENFIVPTDAQLLRAIAVAIRGTRSAWASVAALCDILNVARCTLMSAIDRSSWWCTHINGYVIAKCQQAVFAHTPERLTNAPRDMLALALGMSYGL